MKISRKRYVIMRNNRKEIWCGLARSFHFKPVDEVKDVAVKTYRSRRQAETSSCYYKDFEVVPVIETIEIAEGD